MGLQKSSTYIYLECFCIKSYWSTLKVKSKPTIPFLLHSEWDPPPQQQLFLIRLQSSAEYWYLHQTTNSQSQDDYDTNQLPSQVWNKEDIEIFKNINTYHKKKQEHIRA